MRFNLLPTEMSTWVLPPYRAAGRLVSHVGGLVCTITRHNHTDTSALEESNSTLMGYVSFVLDLFRSTIAKHGTRCWPVRSSSAFSFYPPSPASNQLMLEMTQNS